MSNNLLLIKERWDLPEEYLKFLEKNNIEKFVGVKDDEGFDGEIRLYGSSDLISNQDGYSYNPVTKKVIEVWPKDYIVIADSDADPFVLDLSQSNGKDAPILFAFHGESEWSFEKYSDSFKDFVIKKLDIK